MRAAAQACLSTQPRWGSYEGSKTGAISVGVTSLGVDEKVWNCWRIVGVLLVMCWMYVMQLITGEGRVNGMMSYMLFSIARGRM